MKNFFVVLCLSLFLVIGCPKPQNNIPTQPENTTTQKQEIDGFLGYKWKTKPNLFSEPNCKFDLDTTSKVMGLESYKCFQPKTYKSFSGFRTQYMYYNGEYFLGRIIFDPYVNIDEITKVLYENFGSPLKKEETTEVFSQKIVDTRKEWKSGMTSIFLDYDYINGEKKLTMAYIPITWLVDQIIKQQNSNFDDDN